MSTNKSNTYPNAMLNVIEHYGDTLERIMKECLVDFKPSKPSKPLDRPWVNEGYRKEVAERLCKETGLSVTHQQVSMWMKDIGLVAYRTLKNRDVRADPMEALPTGDMMRAWLRGRRSIVKRGASRKSVLVKPPKPLLSSQPSQTNSQTNSQTDSQMNSQMSPLRTTDQVNAVKDALIQNAANLNQRDAIVEAIGIRLRRGDITPNQLADSPLDNAELFQLVKNEDR